MAEVTDDFADNLRAVRGEFQNTKGGRIGNRILAHVFSTFFPILLIVCLVLVSELSWPLEKDAWLFIGFAVLTLGVGIILHRAINCRYVFDDEGIQAYRANGQVKEAIRWADLTKINYFESRGIRSFVLITNDGPMQLEFYKSLSEAIAELEKKKG
jgi:hypothetical protein